MGRTFCEKHRLSSIELTCQHVAEEIKNKRYGRFHDAAILLVCEDCLHKYHLEPLEDNSLALSDPLSDDERLDEIFHELEIFEHMEGRATLCSECIAVAKVEQARRNGEIDPFPTYERTLNSNHGNEIESFQTQLSANFKFAKSVRPFAKKNPFALFIKPGAYTYPLTVMIYYVTSESQQEQIIQFIIEYFRWKDLNQVKVQFYEAEVWKLKSNPETGISSAERGMEKLLREVCLNCLKERE